MNAQTNATVRPLELHELLSRDNLAAITDLKGVARDLRVGAEFTKSYFQDLADNAGRHAKATQADLQQLQQRHSAAARTAAEDIGRMQPADLAAYATDVWQRWVLFIDTMRQRGNNFVQHESEGCPPVLAYEYDTVVDGATLERPVNYSLVAIRAPKGVTTGENSRPYVIIDPRAGHGSGIGGFKSESEVGVALRAGHPVYFCIFTTHPAPTQTLADVTRAEAHFVREVQRRHPDSPKPVVMGNCQGGWAAMLLAATNPDLTGPLVLNGTPLSYWAGTRGKNPMRYMGGLLGGIVPAMLAADLGNGEFDGANLVSNFENLNPGNSLWKKYYDVFAGTEQESERYLEFERWWSGFYFMNENEIRWIVENLFVGNRLARGGAQLDARMHVDLRNVRAPVIVFASHGDNITPPAQALNWIPDVYASVQEIKARGQRIFYTVHDSVGHLGIFVSAAVAMKEHKEIVSTLGAIEAMAPGLYEMKIVHESGEGIDKRFTIDFEEREVQDILALDDGRDDEKAFSAVSRLAQLGAELYGLTLRPVMRALGNEGMARWGVNTQSLRARRFLLSDRNPLLLPVAALAESVRANRAEAPEGNPLLHLERTTAELITAWYDSARDLRDAWIETCFYGIYGSPLMRAIGAGEMPRISEVPDTDLRAVPEVRQALAQIRRGNYAVAVIRMLILLARSRKSVRRDRLERANATLTATEPFASLGEANRTRIIHQQTVIVEFEPEQALATLPLLLPDHAERIRALQQCEYVAGSSQEMGQETRDLYQRIRVVLGLAAEATPGNGAASRPAPARRARTPRHRAQRATRA